MKNKVDYVKKKINSYYQLKKIKNYYKNKISRTKTKYKWKKKKSNINKYYKKKTKDKGDNKKSKINKYYKRKIREKKLIKTFRELSKTQIIYQIIRNLASRATRTLKKKGIKRKISHMKLIDCSTNKLEKYLLKKFKKGMSFDNYGKWELDHKKPISSFDLTNEDEMKCCFNYKNLQPLWMRENRSKGSKVEPRKIMEVDGYKICVDFIDDDEIEINPRKIMEVDGYKICVDFVDD